MYMLLQGLKSETHSAVAVASVQKKQLGYFFKE
jgi:hypothetical protein